MKSAAPIYGLQSIFVFVQQHTNRGAKRDPSLVSGDEHAVDPLRPLFSTPSRVARQELDYDASEDERINVVCLHIIVHRKHAFDVIASLLLHAPT